MSSPLNVNPLKKLLSIFFLHFFFYCMLNILSLYDPCCFVQKKLIVFFDQFFKCIYMRFMVMDTDIKISISLYRDALYIKILWHACTYAIQSKKICEIKVIIEISTPFLKLDNEFILFSSYRWLLFIIVKTWWKINKGSFNYFFLLNGRFNILLTCLEGNSF